MLRSEAQRDALRSLEFDAMPLAVVEAQRMGLKSTFARNGENGSRIESPAQEYHCFLTGGHGGDQ
jgi:hypothetical protein